ncbi:MAG: hypothetical protein CYPHOPRED_004440 [Cyphobasidiales sp. Tagirdzhanova-0007]|nr:MAG: hypothetical protein CYPHOPRED_004440 [Cyphobasidiales sp. Tagirdzhanova-0007]
MPSSSTLAGEEKDKIKKAIQSGKIVAAAVARIYYAFPDPDTWAYSGVEGALVFGTQDNGFWFRLVDLGGTRGVIWEHEFYEDFELHQDRTFFYSFPGDECMLGFAFSDEGEAADLSKKLQNRKKYAAKKSRAMPSFSLPSMSSSSPNLSPQSKDKKKRRGLAGLFDRSSISQPKDVKHVAHMGFDSEKGGVAENVDPSWEKLLVQLSGFGITRDFAENNRDFIKEFIKDAGIDQDGEMESSSTGPPAPPPPVPPFGKRVPSSQRVPPAPPSIPAPVTGGRSGGPPPPRTSRFGMFEIELMSPLTLESAAPPMSVKRGSAPAPPPPPGGRAAPPPPPPGGPATALPVPAGGRADLLASIRGTGGAGALRKVSSSSTGTPREEVPSTPTSGAAGGAEGGNLAAALAAALTVRRAGTGDSDEDGDSEDEWDD